LKGRSHLEDEVVDGREFNCTSKKEDEMDLREWSSSAKDASKN
jgi:hypothetical protein